MVSSLVPPASDSPFVVPVVVVLSESSPSVGPEALLPAYSELPEVRPVASTHSDERQTRPATHSASSMHSQPSVPGVQSPVVGAPLLEVVVPAAVAGSVLLTPELGAQATLRRDEATKAQVTCRMCKYISAEREDMPGTAATQEIEMTGMIGNEEAGDHPGRPLSLWPSCADGCTYTAGIRRP